MVLICRNCGRLCCLNYEIQRSPQQNPLGPEFILTSPFSSNIRLCSHIERNNLIQAEMRITYLNLLHFYVNKALL